MILITPGKALGSFERPRLGFTLGYVQTRSRLLSVDSILSQLPVSVLESRESDDVRGYQGPSALTSTEVFYVEGSDHVFTVIGDQVWDVTSREPVGIVGDLAATGAAEEIQYVHIPDTLSPSQTAFGALSVQKHAQTLTLDEPSRISGMSVWVRKFFGNPTDLVVVTLYSWDGTSNIEGGTPYASSGIDNSRITSSFQNLRVDAAVDVPAGQYVLVLERAGALSNNDFYATQRVLTGNYDGGTNWVNVNGIWSDGAPVDMLMTLWGPAVPGEPDIESEIPPTTLLSEEPT